MKYNDNGTYKDIYVKAFDTLPVGTEVDYDGSVVPDGWSEVTDPNTYSTDEVRIGTWIDGKPLYRKVLETTDIRSDKPMLIDSNLDLIINAYGTAIRNPGSNYTLPRINKENVNGQIGFYYVDNELHVEIGTAVTNVIKIIVVVEYTKTTD